MKEVLFTQKLAINNIGFIMKKLYYLSFFFVVFLCVFSLQGEEFSGNPFYSFSEKDIAKIIICFGEQIYGPGESFDAPREEVLPVESYLKPSGYAIRDRKTISELYNAAKTLEIDIGGYTFSGILSYQVYLDKKGRVLAIVHIVNYESYISIGKGYIKNRWIHLELPSEDDFIIAGRSTKYCRIIYEFMKKYMPKKIKELDKMYKEQGGLEKVLFKEPENSPKTKPSTEQKQPTAK